MNKNILITGGGGYVGSYLVPFLLKKDFHITVYDRFYFNSNYLPNHKNLRIINGDIRDITKFEKSLENIDCVIHLACISNDASFELDKDLSKSTNLDCFEPLVKTSKKNGVKRFIYCSTSSVYGVSDKPEVKEDHEKVPLTYYNEYKYLCEPILLKYLDDNFCGSIIRPATVCGLAPRMRLDLSVNILTYSAVSKKKITVFGGSQLRPNLNIKDMCRVYELFINMDKNLIQGEAFNIGYQNLSIDQIATMVKNIYESKFKDKIEIEHKKSDDIRSYHINSDKIKSKLNFEPQFAIEDAITEMIDYFSSQDSLEKFDDTIFYNVKHLKKDLSA
jgi:nucleoside-diphosphate-sugar epimerase